MRIAPEEDRDGPLFRPVLTARAKGIDGFKRSALTVRGVEYLNQHTIDWNEEKNVYYWYYATQVTHHMEGEAWKKWNAVMRQELPKNQVQNGKEGGSWDPSGDRWASYGGRLYETCLCIYMLEVYYRHLPIYKWRGK